MRKAAAGFIILGMIALQGCSSRNTAEQADLTETVQQEAVTPISEKEEEDHTMINEANKDTAHYNQASIRYSPENYKMWDAWCVSDNDEIHLIHLKGLKEGFDYNMEEENKRGFGHAVSTDLLHWSEQEDILKVDPGKNYLDNEFRYTGSTIEYQGTYYTFYTMRKGQGQRIGVATSKDLYSWSEYDKNPVLVPDEKWFITYANENVSNNKLWGGTVDCRDLVVVRDEEGGGFWGYFVASADRGLTAPTSVIGLAYSRDLLEWEQLGIVYEPEGVTMPEMIDVFEYNGRWYMTLTTAKNNGSIGAFSDPYITRAQIYASADSPGGPFLENKEDNVLMGGQIDSGYSSRTIDYKGKKRILYVDGNGGNSVISLPKDIGVDSEGNLRMYYSEDILKALRTEALADSIATQPNNSFAWKTKGGTWKKEDGTYSCSTDPKSWQAFLMKGISSNLELAFTVKAKSSCSSFGIVISSRGDGNALNDIDHILVVDREQNKVYLTNAQWEMKNAREYSFDEAGDYHFRMLLAGNTVELYINDEMVFNSGILNGGTNRAGLFVNDGSIWAENLELYGLEKE
jgi:beta-fructofuranosidase